MKILRWYSETVNERSENAMAKRGSTFMLITTLIEDQLSYLS
jgi:hypothetical protein